MLSIPAEVNRALGLSILVSIIRGYGRDFFGAYTLCGDFNLTTFYNIGEENKNIIFGIITLLIIVILELYMV